MPATGIQPWVNGPVVLLVGTGQGYALEKLGLCENGLGISEVEPATPVHSDDLGPETPRDALIYPTHAFIRFVIDQWDETVWQKVVSRKFKAGNQTGGTSPGTFPRDYPGTLSQFEGYNYRLLIAAPYNTKAAYAAMLPHNFLSARLEGQVEHGPMGTVKKKHAGVFHAYPMKQSSGDWITYNADDTGLPSTYYQTTPPLSGA